MAVAGAARWRTVACAVVAIVVLAWPPAAPAASGRLRAKAARSHEAGGAGCPKGARGRACRQRRRAARAGRPATTAAPPAPARPHQEPADASACAHADVPAARADVEAVAAATRCLLDAARDAAGLPPLRDDPQLARSAQAHAEDMVTRRYFAHDTPEGVTGAERARAAGYASTAFSEAIATAPAAVATARNVVDAWLASAGHRAVLLSAQYRDTGVGVAAGTPEGAPGGTWVVDLGGG